MRCGIVGLGSVWRGSVGLGAVWNLRCILDGVRTGDLVTEAVERLGIGVGTYYDRLSNVWVSACFRRLANMDIRAFRID